MISVIDTHFYGDLDHCRADWIGKYRDLQAFGLRDAAGLVSNG